MDNIKVRDTELNILKCLCYSLGAVALILLVLAGIKVKQRNDAISNMKNNVVTVKIDNSLNATSYVGPANGTIEYDYLNLRSYIKHDKVIKIFS